MSESTSNIKRKMCRIAFTIGLPGYYFFRNRAAIVKGQQIMREFYIKDIIARSCLGYCLGFAVSLYFYGYGPLKEESP